MSNPHPTAGRCKRCGEPLPRLWMPHPFATGENIADRWCSSHCYGVELREQSVKHCRSSRIALGIPQAHPACEDERDAA